MLSSSLPVQEDSGSLNDKVDVLQNNVKLSVPVRCFRLVKLIYIQGLEILDFRVKIDRQGIPVLTPDVLKPCQTRDVPTDYLNFKKPKEMIAARWWPTSQANSHY